jgi:hypothetical protein
MFFIGVSEGDNLRLLRGEGVAVRINGEATTLWREQNCLRYGTGQPKKILSESRIDGRVDYVCANDATNLDGCVLLQPAIENGNIVIHELR